MAIKGCILPWIHLHGNMKGQYKACCFSDTFGDQYSLGTSQQTILDVWHGEEYKSLRQTFLDDKIPPQCYDACFRKEELGVYENPKNNVNKRWKHKEYLQETLTPPLPVYIDFRLGNTCNFRCRTCGTYSSTSWIKEAKLLFNIEGKKLEYWDTKVFWEGLDLIYSNLEVIYFAGGEPLVLEQHYKILEYLISKNKTDITLQYNTNLSILNFKNYKLVDLWNHFKEIKLWISCDGYKDVCEYVRKELIWKDFESNVDKMLPYITTISSVVSIFTIYSMPDLLLWAKKKSISLFGSTLVSPPSISLQILPKEEKQKILSFYKQFIKENKHKLTVYEINHISDWLRYMMGENPDAEILQKTFKKNISLLDRSRNENFTAVVPQLADWYDSIKIS